MNFKMTSRSFSIVFENDDFAILNKKRGVPTAPLKKGDFSLLTEFLEARPAIEKVIGKKEVEAGLLHRLDTATSGIVLIAKKQKIFDALNSMQNCNLIEKEYIAICDFLPLTSKDATMQKSFEKTFELSSYFLPFGKGAKKVKAVFDLDVLCAKKKQKVQDMKKYITQVIIGEREKDAVTCTCRISKGYRHQVRCHLSYLGLPIKGDALYNTKYIEENKETIEEEVKAQSYPLQLYACKISFPNPCLFLSQKAKNVHGTERLSFSIALDAMGNTE